MKSALLFLVLPGLAFGGPELSVKREQLKWELRDKDGAPVKDAGGVWIRTDTPEQCEAEGIKVYGPTLVNETKWRCSTAISYTATGICTGDNPPPPDPVDADGFKVKQAIPAPELCAGGIDFRIVGPVWKVVYPKCGEYVQTELKACGQVVPDTVKPTAALFPVEQEQPNTMEPGPWIAGVDYPANAPCPAEANGNCYTPPTVAVTP